MHKLMIGLILIALSTTTSAQVLNKLSASDSEQIFRLLRSEPDVFMQESRQSFSVQPEDGISNYYYLGSSVTSPKTNNPDYRAFCTFDLFNNTWKSIGKTNAHIKDYEGTNVCNMIVGLAGVGWWYAPTEKDTTLEHGDLKYQKGFVAILQYHGGTAVQPAKNPSQIGNSYRWTAALFEFKKDSNGQWSIVQDDTCFDPLNQIDTLVKAKKVFDSCHPPHR